MKLWKDIETAIDQNTICGYCNRPLRDCKCDYTNDNGFQICYTWKKL